MPVARSNDGTAGRSEAGGHGVERLDDLVTPSDGERPTGAEVVLYIDDQQSAIGLGRPVHGSAPSRRTRGAGWIDTNYFNLDLPS
jgi:hypothetical protein